MSCQDTEKIPLAHLFSLRICLIHISRKDRPGFYLSDSASPLSSLDSHVWLLQRQKSSTHDIGVLSGNQKSESVKWWWKMGQSEFHNNRKPHTITKHREAMKTYEKISLSTEAGEWDSCTRRSRGKRIHDTQERCRGFLNAIGMSCQFPSYPWIWDWLISFQ